MTNFFKKLTGSFRMQSEDEVLNEKDNHAEVELEPQDDEAIQTEPDGGEVEQPQVSESEEGPYTITELAKASISAKKSEHKGHLPILLHDKDDEEEVAAPSAPEGQLAIDVYETPSEIVIKSTIAGVKADDLDIGIEENTVNIRGARHNEERVRGEDYFYQECYWGAFSRSIILPTEVDNENASAALQDGILTIRLPKIKKQKETKIKVAGARENA